MSFVPHWWAMILLVLAVARITRLVGWDDLTIPLRTNLTGLGDEQHKQYAYAIEHQQEIGTDPWDIGKFRDPIKILSTRLSDATGNTGVPPILRSLGPQPPVSQRRWYFSKLLRCPWCAGWWISLGWWVLWLAFPHPMLICSSPFALSELVGLVSKNLDEH